MKLKEAYLSNNEVITYYDEGVTTSREVLILVHGNTSSALFFQPLIKVLPRHIRVIAPNLRGFSNSTYHNKINNISDFTNDLKLMLDNLLVDHCHLLGWELGGAVVMDFASRYPNRISSLILMSSVPPSGYPIYRKDENANPVIGGIYKNRDDLSSDPVDVEPFTLMFNNRDINLLSHLYDYLIYPSKKPGYLLKMSWMEDLILQRNIVDTRWALANFNITPLSNNYVKGSNRISNIKAKTLILWGNKDLIITKRMFDETLKYFPNNTNMIFDNGGHSLIVDDLPLLVKTIIDFIL